MAAASTYLPKQLTADLVLDFLVHPDLSYDLAALCAAQKIPIVASGKKAALPSVLTPPTWCALALPVGLGSYGERFGQPWFRVVVAHAQLRRLEVVRGAPCGATWALPQRLEGLPVAAALEKIGLATQFFCVADPAGWDPVSGRRGDRSPVHLAGDLHRAALARALTKPNPS